MNAFAESFIRQIEQKTGLKFQKEIGDRNLCFRNNNQDLRDEFKEYFSEEDFKFYIHSFMDKEVTLPIDNLDFWNRVNHGKQRKK